ncbi:MAG: hypothetical protein ACLP2P_01345 [Desulfobaccales bacterium]
MVVEPGEKLFIVTRRLFEGDLRRHFVGEVKVATESTVRLEGYTFVFDAGIGKFVRGERRGRIFGLGDNGFIITIIPKDADLDKVSHRFSDKGGQVLSDGKTFELHVNEFSER